MPWVAGVDGCRSGWVAVLLQCRGGIVEERWDVHAAFSSLLELEPPPELIAVDIPIGLLDSHVSGGRDCDREARRILGRPRSSSVFSPPLRGLLQCETYAEVRGHGLTRQAFGILPKIREVDRLMTPALQQMVREAHPELIFQAMSGHSMEWGKKTKQGSQVRKRLLRKHFRRLDTALRQLRPKGAQMDDVLDAYALGWTAARMLAKEAVRIPSEPPVDARGLRMEIWF